MARMLGIAFGLGTQAFFLFTAYHLFWFLRIGHLPYPSFADSSTWSPLPAVAWNGFLAIQFAIPHSWLLHPTTRQGALAKVPTAFYGCLFCCVTCVNLWIMFLGWVPSPIVPWQATGSIAVGITSAFFGSWIALLYSISLTGLGYQTGFTPWSYWFRRQGVPRRPWKIRGIYHGFRHPVYLSFLGLIWFTPRLSLDRIVLLAVWTIYIYVGSVLKDRRLIYYLGDSYRQYAEGVPGYPGMFVGPLARLPRRDPAIPLTVHSRAA